MEKRQIESLRIAIGFLILIVLIAMPAISLPAGPTITVLGNSSKSNTGSTKVNSSINGSTPGGYIFTLSLDSRQQNARWKAYVGNVTGTLALDDADSNTIFQWSLSTVTGEVYATRASGSVNWSGINCTWHGENASMASESYRAVEEIENHVLNHSNKDDNITATFANTNHSSIQIGSVTIPKNSCFSVQSWQKDAVQSFPNSDEANFTQVILYDGTNNSVNKTNRTAFGKVVYTTKIENDKPGYRTDSTFDFQMLLPENGLSTFASSTAYYFYVELS